MLGIGACSTALKRIGIDVEIVDAVEIDKYAIASFNAIHGTNFEVQDICEWDKDIKDIDLITHGSPCQDFSVAGKQAGGDIGSGTRSSLMYETIRIVGKIRPKYVLWENVKNLLSKKHKHNFDAYIETMNILGYNSYYQVLNAKNHGIPQNRERVFTISIRKDIDKGYTFPEKEELTLRLKDMLEDEVDEKYYLSDEIVSKFVKNESDNTNVIGSLQMDKWQDYMKRIYNIEKYSPTISTYQGGNTEPKILTHNIIQKVKVRKYPVDIEKLKETLRNAKLQSDLTTSKIAYKLNTSLTKAEHWFRTDNCFSIPEPEIWLRLKSLLNIKTDEFDESIMTFEEKDGVYDKANRLYDVNGLAPTLTQQEEKIIEPKVDVIGNYMPSSHDTSRIVNKEGLSPTLDAMQGGWRQPCIEEDIINPLKGISGKSWQFEQNVYANESKCLRSIKAGGGSGNIPKIITYSPYVNKKYEEFIDEKGYIPEMFNPYNKKEIKDIAPSQTTQCGSVTSSATVLKNERIRIRKLTPKECWRLMRI